MKATDLSAGVWNAIADHVARSRSSREVYFVSVTKADKNRNLVWAKDFGDIAIPLVAFKQGFAYYDTTPNAALSGGLVTSKQIRREDKTHTNANFLTEIVCPKVGDLIVVLDPWGAKRFPICVGVIMSKPGFWEGE